MVHLKDTLDKITVADFMEFPKKKDPAMLVIEGEPTSEDIENCWMGLISQYYKATGSEEKTEYIKNSAQAGYLRNRVNTVQSCVSYIRATVDSILQYENIAEIYKELDPLFDILRFFKYDYDFELATVLVKMNMIITSEKQYVVRLVKLEAWIKKQDKERADEAAEGCDNFLEQVKEVRRFENFPLTARQMAKEMMMDEYCGSIMSIKKHNEEMKRLKNKQHGEQQ